MTQIKTNFIHFEQKANAEHLRLKFLFFCVIGCAANEGMFSEHRMNIFDNTKRNELNQKVVIIKMIMGSETTIKTN